MRGSLRAVALPALSSPPLAVRAPACSPTIRTTPSASAGQPRPCSGKGDAGGTCAAGGSACRQPGLAGVARRPVRTNAGRRGRDFGSRRWQNRPTLHGDDDHVVPIGASAPLPPKVVKDARLEIHPGAPHGLATTRKGRLDADLLAFIRARGAPPAAVDRRHANPGEE